MKQFILIPALALSALATQVAAQNVDTSSLTPLLTFPEPAPTPVTQDASGIKAR